MFSLSIIRNALRSLCNFALHGVHIVQPVSSYDKQLNNRDTVQFACEIR